MKNSKCYGSGRKDHVFKLRCNVRGYLLPLLLMLIWSFVLTNDVNAARGPNDCDKSINRINYGVVFHYVGETRPTTSIWHHTLRIQMPTYGLESELLKTNTNDLTDRTSQWSPCLRQLDGEQGRKIIAHPLCRRFLKTVRFLIQISKDGYKRLYQLVEDLNDLIPDRAARGQAKGKRALIPIVGQFFPLCLVLPPKLILIPLTPMLFNYQKLSIKI